MAGLIATGFGALAMVLAVVQFALVFAWMDSYLGTDKNSSPPKYGLDWDDTGGQLFNYHPLFMVTGMASLNIIGVLVYRLSPLEKQANKALHGITLTACLCLLISGLYAVVANHDELGFGHVASAHSWAGITVFGCFCLQWLIGAVCFLVPSIPEDIKALAVPLHVLLGLFTLFGAGVCVISGVAEKIAFMGACTSDTEYVHMSTECRIANSLSLTTVFCIFSAIVALVVDALMAERSDKAGFRSVRTDSGSSDGDRDASQVVKIKPGLSYGSTEEM
eukprot:TRINITY_DN12493_c0_g1_i9.p1 TRINITY_DN12493_c0_g1~~TRINITY_DN12493_c0_g1_i9.p1  ORF type:complete len:277 (+),score=58.75 TRINITY_DN12493_c0_g1_i9:743-1573(+)